MSTSIGDRIFAARIQSGTSRVWLAQQLAITLEAVDAWEVGIGLPDDATLARLAALLKVRAAWLRIGEGEMIAP